MPGVPSEISFGGFSPAPRKQPRLTELASFSFLSFSSRAALSTGIDFVPAEGFLAWPVTAKSSRSWAEREARI